MERRTLLKAILPALFIGLGVTLSPEAEAKRKSRKKRSYWKKKKTSYKRKKKKRDEDNYVVKVRKMNVYSSHTTASKVLVTFNVNEDVHVLSISGQWAYMVEDGVYGWAQLSQLRRK